MYHYTDIDSIRSMLDGRQIRLTKFNEMQLGQNEGRYIFKRLKSILHGMRADEITDVQRSRILREIIEMEEGDKNTLYHFFTDTNKTEKCTPYVFCCTVNMDKKPPWMDETEISLQLSVENLGLKALEIPRDVTKGCYGAIRMTPCFYEEDYNNEWLKSLILHYLREVDDLDDAIDLIVHRIGEIRLSIMDEGLYKEVERRLIFFLPVDKEKHPDLMKYVGKHRAGDSKGCLEEVGDDISKYIYLDFNDGLKQIAVCINPEKTTVDECMQILSGFSTKVIVFDPSWPKV